MKLYERIENNNFDEIDRNRAIELIEGGNGHLVYNENYFKLQKENEELKIKNNAIKRESEAYAENMIRLDNELNLEKEKSKYKWIRQNCLPQELVNKLYISVQTVKDKIEELEEELEIMKVDNMYGRYKEYGGKTKWERLFATKYGMHDALQELLEGRK